MTQGRASFSVNQDRQEITIDDEGNGKFVTPTLRTANGASRRSMLLGGGHDATSPAARVELFREMTNARTALEECSESSRRTVGGNESTASESCAKGRSKSLSGHLTVGDTISAMRGSSIKVGGVAWLAILIVNVIAAYATRSDHAGVAMTGGCSVLLSVVGGGVFSLIVARKAQRHQPHNVGTSSGWILFLAPFAMFLVLSFVWSVLPRTG